MANWKNVNNWHWAEKNCLPWAKTFFEEKLGTIKVQDESGIVSVARVTEVEGDCDLNQRKGKIVPLYDLKLVLSITGTPKTGGGPVSGTLTVPEVSQDSDATSYVFIVELNSSGGKQYQKLEELAKLKLVDEVKEVLLSFDRELIERHIKDVHLETTSSPSTTPTSEQVKQQQQSPAAQPKPTVNFPDMLELDFDAHCPPSDLFRVLTDAKLITIWSRCPATFVAAPSLPFKLFSGTIKGTIIEVERNSSLRLSWRSEGWPEGHESEVSIQLVNMDDNRTKLRIVQKDIPQGWLMNTERHWKDEVVKPILTTFQYGEPAAKSLLASKTIYLTAGLGLITSTIFLVYLASRP